MTTRPTDGAPSGAPHVNPANLPPEIRASLAMQTTPDTFALEPPEPTGKAPAVELISTLLARGWKKSGIAEAIGVHPAQITRVVKGEQTPSPETHKRLVALVESGARPDEPIAPDTGASVEPTRCASTVDLFESAPFDLAEAIAQGAEITARAGELEADSDLQTDLERLAEYEHQQEPVELACFSPDEGKTADAPLAEVQAPESIRDRLGEEPAPVVKPRIDIKDTATRALAASEAVCRHWLPEGKRQGAEWISVNPTRADQTPGSFSVNLDTGKWADFATDDKGGDLVALVAYLDGTHQGDAARVLAEWLGAVPVVETAPKPAKAAPRPMKTRPTAHPKLGAPSAQWGYLDAEGHVLCVVMRFETETGKEFRPITQTPDGWIWKAPDEPRPLYGLDRLAARPEAPIILCEGEKASDAAALLRPDCVHIASMNGAKSPKRSDWSPLQGRRVLIWPDADQPGADFAQTAARLILEAGAQSVEVLDLSSLGVDLPQGADAADLVADGWTPEQFAERARFVAWSAEKTRRPVEPEPGGAPEIRGDLAQAIEAVIQAIEALPDDPGSVLTAEAVDAWAHIYAHDGAEYERLRAKAKQGKARVAEIDRAIGARSKYAKERAGKKKTEKIFKSSISSTSSTGAGSSDTQSYTDPFQSYTSSTDPLPLEPFALVRETENGPRLVIASDAALVVARILQGRFAYCTTAETWHRFTGTHWEPLASPASLYEALTRWMFPATEAVGFTPRYQDSILTVIQRAGMRALPKTPNAIPFANGLLDIETGILSPITPANAATWALPYEYRPGADCPRVKAWLLQAVGDDRDVVELLRAFLSALIRGGAYLQRFLHLIGPGGTGKSTFIRLVEALVGERNAVTTDLKELDQNRFESAALYGKRAALITDSDRYGGSVNKLKAITGQDPVRLERKHIQQSGSFVFEGMVFLASNEPLATTDYTSGIERRRVTIHFERRVSEQEKAAWNALGGEKAVLHAELPGVVNWLLSMPVVEMERRIRNPPEHTVKANIEAMCSGNPCADWLTECCVPDPDAWTQVGECEERRSPDDGEVYYLHADTRLFPSYLAWCKASGRVPLSLRRFRSVAVDAIKTLGFDAREVRRGAGNGVGGVRLRRPEEAPFSWHSGASSAGSAGCATSSAAQNTAPSRASAGSAGCAASSCIIPFFPPRACEAATGANDGDEELF